ncbi:MAG: CHRD domain-containing protein [Chitinophagaceae bacterium]|nr:CHRD domain-containing protein [Chitinophagaceae bacterium]
MKHYLMILLVIVVGSSCKKDNETTVSAEVKYKAVMNGSNEVPANSSTATGEANAVYNTQTKILTVTITYSGLSSALVSWHIHKAAVGVNGSVIFNFGTPQLSGFVYTSAALTTDQEADLNNGLYYVNLHTANYSGGEIRGQLVKQ